MYQYFYDEDLDVKLFIPVILKKNNMNYICMELDLKNYLKLISKIQVPSSSTMIYIFKNYESAITCIIPDCNATIVYKELSPHFKIHFFQAQVSKYFVSY